MRKKFTFLSLIMLLLLGRAMAQSVDITYNYGLDTFFELTFTVIDETNECSVEVYTAPEVITTVDIPTKITIEGSEYYVTEIAEKGFYNCKNFSSIGLPESLKIIGNKAFQNCSSLTGDLIIPDNVTYIGDYAFYGCYNMKGTLKLPEKLVTIGQYAFSRNTNNNNNMGFKGNLVIPNNVKTIGDYAFNYCTSFSGDLIIPNSVETIGNYAFYYCYGFNGKLVISNGVTSIGNNAFYYCESLSGDLVIPNSVTSIGSYAFYNCHSFNGNLILSENITSIGNYTFYNCYNFTGDLAIPNGVKTIGSYAFYNCNKFTNKLILPASLSSIGNNAFEKCSKFTVLNCHAVNPPSIQYSTFTDDHSIANAYVPEGAEDIYDETYPWNELFRRFKSFVKVENYEIETKDQNGNVLYSLIYNTTDDYSGVNVKIGQRPTTNVELVIPESIKYTPKNFTYNVTTIPAKAFKDCSFFTGVEIPKYVNNIGENAFAGCSNINIIKSFNPIPPSAADNSFRNATARVAASSFDGIPTTARLFVFPNYMDYYDIEPWNRFEIKPLLIDHEEFYYEGNSYYTLLFNLNEDYNSLRVKMGRISRSPKTLDIPNSVYDFDVTTIEDKAFYFGKDGYWNDEGNYVYTWSFNNLTLTNNLTHIGDSAFYNCYGFTGELNIPNNVTSIGDYAFYNCYGFTSNLSIPNSVTSIGNYAFYNCYGFTGELNIPNSVTSIGNYAFNNCYNFTGELNIPNSVTSIGEGAFSNCNGFTGELNIPNSVTYIGNSAFYHCEGFNGNLSIPNSITAIGDYAFYYCRRLEGQLNIPNSVTSIGNGAFYNCRNLTGELIIPNSIVSIGNSAFYDCDGFTSLSFEENSKLETIGNEAFGWSHGFTGKLIIPNSVTFIGSSAFYNCYGFTSLSFEENSKLETIGNSAFSDIYIYSELIIPNSLTSIGNYAFGWNDFSRVICYSTSPASFTGDESIFTSSTIYVPAISLEEYKAAWKKDASRFNANGLPTFLGGDIDDVNNWYVLEDGSKVSRLPNANEEIAINAALTINDDEMLNVKSLGYCENGDLTMKEGGQLKCNKHYSDIKVEKNIKAHGTETTTTKWTTISSPLATVMNPSEITNLTSGNYDLYRYDEPSAVWQNYKNSASNSFTNLESGRGYIYSNEDDTQLTFEGKTDGATSVSYELTKDSEKLPGFHLIGNPYTHNISLDNLSTSADSDKIIITLSNSWSSDNYIQITSEDGSVNETYQSDGTYELTGCYGKKLTVSCVHNAYMNYSYISIRYENEAYIYSNYLYYSNDYGTTTLTTFTVDNKIPKNILAEGYYSLSNEGAWGVKYGEETEIKPCQGILVKTTEAGYLNINSEAPQTRSEKRSVNNFLAITVANSKYEDKAYISFNEGVGLDKIAHENENIPMVYIPGNDADYAVAIQDKNFKEIPIYFEAGGMGEYTISVSQSECGFDRLYLYDKAEGKTVNILKRDYTFFATSSDFPDRFVLKTVNDEVLEDFTYINNGNLVIENIVGNANIEIFDVLGRNVMQNNCSDDEYEIATSRFTAGVYIIRKTDDNGIKTQKVVID